MAILPRAALLLLALAVAVAPAVAADEAGGAGPPAGGSVPGGNETDPVGDIEDCLCNGTGNETSPGGNETGNQTAPACTLPGCVTDPDARLSCSPMELDPFVDNPMNTVQVDPEGCYRAAIKKAISGAPPVVRNLVCSLMARLP